jgi:hypothetical protein
MNILLLKPLCFLVIFALIINAMSDSAPKSIDSDSSSTAPAVHIIYTEKPQEEEPETYHIRTLTAVLGRFALFSLSIHVVWLF